jgi:hypothetical protein
MSGINSVEIVERFWNDVWRRPRNPDAIDALVAEDFVITSGGKDIVSRETFKRWVVDFQSKIHEMDFETIESFQNHDGSRVASRWRLTGRNNGILGTEANGAPIEIGRHCGVGGRRRWPTPAQLGRAQCVGSIWQSYQN